LLVFRHPVAGVQIPKGSVESGERPEDAVLRELAEESGVTSARILRSIGRHEIEVGAGPTETGPLELQVWHTFLLAAGEELPETWSHRVSGSTTSGFPSPKRAAFAWLDAMLPSISSRRPCGRAPTLLASTAAVAEHGNASVLMLLTNGKSAEMVMVIRSSIALSEIARRVE
jgi:ADP-ribose pyrophosphatase YjhB (NUDIX family)